VEREDEVPINFVYQKRIGNSVNYGVFHSKLIVYEFDEFIRVIVSSANLYEHDWIHMSQVIWF
jgi:hypothetical protein